MNYTECIEQARGRIGSHCKACWECNGRACKNQMPGPGAKGIGDTAIRNYDKWKEIRVQMDTLVENSLFLQTRVNHWLVLTVLQEKHMPISADVL